VTAVRIEVDRIMQTFRPDRKRLCSPYRLRIISITRVVCCDLEKLTMTEAATLRFVDQTPRTPFDFSLPDYNGPCGLLEEHPCARPHRLHADFATLSRPNRDNAFFGR